MTNTIPLSAATERTARQFAEAGRTEGALRLIGQLLARPDSVGPTAARLRRFAATLLISLSRFPAARKQLALAARLDPADAETAFRLGERFERDEDGDLDRAVTWYRRAVKLDPQNARYLVACGKALCHAGQTKRGMESVTAAVERCPDDANILGVAVEACRLAGHCDVARRWIARARFLAGNDAAVSRLWDRVRFDLVIESQRTVNDEPRRTVPFLRLVGEDRFPVRRDVGRRTKPHFPRLAAFA